MLTVCARLEDESGNGLEVNGTRRWPIHRQVAGEGS